MDATRDSLSVLLHSDPQRSVLLRRRLGTAPHWSRSLSNFDIAKPSGCLLSSLGCSKGDIDTYIKHLQKREQRTAGDASAACTAIWKPRVLAYRCRTCQVNDNCAICQDCFQAGDHTNHDYSMYFSFAGGCCDCGDATSWKPSGFCPRHTGQANTEQPNAQLDALEQAIAKAVLSWAVQELCLAVHTCAKPADIPSDRRGAQGVAMCLLSWLQKLCAVPVLRTLTGHLLLQSTSGLLAAVQPFVDCSYFPMQKDGNSFPSESASQLIGKWSAEYVALDCLLEQFAQVFTDVMQELMTLMLQLLFEPAFKRSFTVVILRHYSRLMEEWSVKPPEAVMPLDMITVQLFNDEASTRAVEGLLHTLMAALFKLTSTTVAKQAASPSHFIASKTYTRILQDLKTVLAHPWAVTELLTEHLPVLMDTVALLDSFKKYERKLGTHAEWPDDAWLNPVQLEVMLFGQALLPILSGVLGTRHLDINLSQLCQAVLASVNLLCQQSQQDQVPQYATPHTSSGTHCGSCCIWNHLLTGGLVSVHLSKQRAITLLVKALLGLHAQAVDRGDAADIKLMGEVTAAVVGPDNRMPLQMAAPTISYQALAQPMLTLQVWRAQVQANMWIRNGPEVVQLQHVYQSPYWSDTSLTLDLLSLQLWLAHAGCNEVLADFMRSFGGETLTQAAWGLAGLAPLPSCPALTGTELDPHAALNTLHQHNTSQSSITMDTVFIPQEVQAGLVRQAAEGEADAAAVLADPRQMRLGRDHSSPGSDAPQGTDHPQSQAAVSMLSENSAESVGQDGAGVGLDWVEALLGAGSTALQEPQLVCIVQGMRLLVTLLRERHTWEPGVARQIRWHLVHGLCHKDQTYTELQDLLPSQFSPHHQIFDQVLAEVATFVTPSTLHRGHYCLKKEMWAELDPFYPQYTPKARQAAVSRGLEQKLWQPHQQLRGFPDSLPDGLTNLQHVPTCAFSLRLVQVCLAYSQRHPSTAADDLAIAALNLLALAVPVLSEGHEAPAFAVIQSMVQRAGGSQALQSSSILEQLKTIGQSEAGQRSVELQDCAQHLHSKLTQLAKRHNLLDSGRGSGVVPDNPEPKAGNPGEGSPVADAAAERRAQAKARQAAMMAKMRQQQAHFTDQAPPARPDDTDSQDEDMADAETEQQQQQAPPSGEAPAGAFGAGLHAQALEGECALCGSGNGAEPLGWVTQLHCCAVASFVQQPPPAWQDTPCSPGAGGSAAWEAGTSFLDEQAGPSLLCCGHMLHTSCLATHRTAMARQHAADDFMEGSDLLDLGQREFLCPVCRRLGNTLVPALAPLPLPLPSPRLSSQGSTDSSSLQSQLQAVVQTIAGLKPLDGALGLPFANAMMGKYHTLAMEAVGDAHGLMRLTTKSIAKQDGERQNADSSIAEDNNALSSRGRTEHAAATHPTEAASSEGNADTSTYQACRSIYGHYGYKVGGAYLTQPVQCLSQAVNTAQLVRSMLAHSVAAWEMQHRPGGVCRGSDAEAISAAQWRGMQALAVSSRILDAYFCRTSLSARMHSHLLAQSRWLTATDTQEDATRYAGGFGQSLSPLMRLSLRAIQAQLPSHHSLFSEAGARPLSLPHTASTNADSLPTASQSQVQTIGESDSKSIDTDGAGQNDRGGGGHSTDYVTPRSRDIDTVMGHGNGGSVDQNDVNAPAGSAAVGAHLAAGSEGEEFDSTSLQPPSAEAHASPQEGHEATWQQLVRDPFALLMHLLALTQSPQESADPDKVASVSAASAAAGDRVTAFQALVRLVYIIAVVQAAHFRRLTGKAAPPQGVNEVLAPHLLPFLRRAHIVQSLITSATASDIQASLPFCQQTEGVHAGAESSRQAQETDAVAALQMLLAMFALPPPIAVLASLEASPNHRELQHRWVHLPAVVPACEQLEQQLQQRKQALCSPRLMHLPNQFQELFLQLVAAPCSRCGRPPKEGALCLQCGAFMCAGDPKCRNAKGEGNCKDHALACGGGSCAFLLMKMTKVLLISASRACFAPSPYLDTHGEEDLYLNRGRPLYLNQQRLLRLNQLWVASAFDFDSPTLHNAFGGNLWRAAHYW